VVTPVLVGRCRSQLELVVLAVQVVQSPCLLEAVPVVLAAQSRLLLVQQVQTRVRVELFQSQLVRARVRPAALAARSPSLVVEALEALAVQSRSLVARLLRTVLQVVPLQSLRVQARVRPAALAGRLNCSLAAAAAVLVAHLV
jgi:hypothetical protein